MHYLPFTIILRPICKWISSCRNQYELDTIARLLERIKDQRNNEIGFERFYEILTREIEERRQYLSLDLIIHQNKADRFTTLFT